jgi:hypothetical protein
MGGKKVGSSAHPITDFDLPIERGSKIERTPIGKGMRAPGTGNLRAPGRIREENADASEKERK